MSGRYQEGYVNGCRKGRADCEPEIERLRAALQAITDLCKTSPANPFLADDMDRIAISALSEKATT